MWSEGQSNDNAGKACQHTNLREAMYRAIGARRPGRLKRQYDQDGPEHSISRKLINTCAVRSPRHSRSRLPAPHLVGNVPPSRWPALPAQEVDMTGAPPRRRL